ncbi:Homeobox-leucine zipper protein HOX14 [Hordeum vulgare]|nr:Homeobox-leucine zipper protein HOX14 [Hordeum vulgare]
MTVASMSSSGSRSSGATTPPVAVKPETQETSLRRRSRGGNLVINEGRRQPSPPCDHLRLVKSKKEPAVTVVVKKEHKAMVADLNVGHKWSRKDYVREEIERERIVLDEIVERCRSCEEGGIIVFSDGDKEATASTPPVRNNNPRQGISKNGEKECTVDGRQMSAHVDSTNPRGRDYMIGAVHRSEQVRCATKGADDEPLHTVESHNRAILPVCCFS